MLFFKVIFLFVNHISKFNVFCRKDMKIVILNGMKWSEESPAYDRLRFFAEPVLERSEGLRMTPIQFSTEQIQR